MAIFIAFNLNNEIHMEMKNKFKYITIVILLIYLLCWFYVLLVSLHTLPPDAFMWIWEILDNIEPFSYTCIK